MNKMRVGVSALALLALAACAPQVPDSAAGVGFGSYQDYSLDRERALRGDSVASAPASDSAAIAAQALATLRPDEAGAAPVITPAPGDPLPRSNNPSLSDEQNFAAVAARESIESDRERLQQQRQQYAVVAPEPVPERPSAAGVNIAQYALSTTNRVGEPIHRRLGRVSHERYLSNCARYGSADLAQEAFLAAGGPERDRLGLDPDGDGFACFWDPAPFRAAVRR
ncbi:hypothetical protein [Rhodovulum strictum]|uniref:Excalibur calcium-binding domain-containing protein n=1 Tax=Rhodovulum strictum TaxID=58314 RepID=A0A844BBR0_9RHOB|nr:hypothetical protein [Rhodovulum strictum]MRH20068.1 hypothetical protein [Rhodovulum strictum]